mmetsp:Transcript_6886/g.26027  ORF Transcript_6886/g.26027 Transcript_6886/m.26027 type:complete len:393 (+) Transcript_6886:1109-2287(+)
MNRSKMKGRSGATVWWFPTSKTGRRRVPFPSKGTAPKPGITVPSSLVEKNTGDTTERNVSRPSKAARRSFAHGGLNLGSLDMDGVSLGRLGANPFSRITAVKSTPASCSAACDAPCSVCTTHDPGGMRFIKRVPSSALGIRLSFVDTRTRVFMVCLFVGLDLLEDSMSSISPNLSSAPTALTEAHPSSKIFKRCASVFLGIIDESWPRAGKRFASSANAAATPAGVCNGSVVAFVVEFKAPTAPAAAAFSAPSSNLGGSNSTGAKTYGTALYTSSGKLGSHGPNNGQTLRSKLDPGFTNTSLSTKSGLCCATPSATKPPMDSPNRYTTRLPPVASVPVLPVLGSNPAAPSGFLPSPSGFLIPSRYCTTTCTSVEKSARSFTGTFRQLTLKSS